MHRYRFALRPKWIFGHLIVLALLVGFIDAGFWQLRRLGQRRTFNTRIEQNLAAPIAPLGQVLTAGHSFADADRVLDRRVRVTGHYLIDREVVITGQADPNDDPGAWLVTPLQQHDGTVVLISRGWISSTGNVKSSPPYARPPTGEVTVVGTITQTQTPSAGESKEPATGVLDSMLRIDVARFQKQIPYPLVPAYVQLASQAPPSTSRVVPTVIAPLAPSDGPNLGYAEQWFAFTVMTLVAYPILLWKVAGDREKEARSRGENDDPYDDLPEGAFVDDEGIIDLTGVGASGRHTD